MHAAGDIKIGSSYPLSWEMSHNIYVGSGGDYNDDFNDLPILHEYGHYVTDIASTFDYLPPWKTNDHTWDTVASGGSEMAWNEGFANFFCVAVANEFSSVVSCVSVPAGVDYNALLSLSRGSILTEVVLFWGLFLESIFLF